MALNGNLSPSLLTVKGQKNATVFITQYRCVEINLCILCDLTLKFIKKWLSIKAFSRISETFHKYFLQIEVEEEDRTFF